MSRNTITPEMLSNITLPMAAGVLVFCKGTGEFLLVKRRPNASVFPSMWAIPAGESNVNQFESAENCARREMLEETGYEIPHTSKLRLIDRYESYGRIFFIFLHTVDKKFFVQLCREHTEANWFSANNIPYNVTPNVLDAITRLNGTIE